MPTKREDGVEYHANAFLFVPDSNKPSTWKLRYREMVNGVVKVTREQLGRVSAALSSGGFRGNRVQLPGDAIKGIKRRLRGLYRSLGVKPEMIPPHIREQRDGGLITEGVKLEDLFEGPIMTEEALSQIDKESGVLKGVAMLGPVSANRRRYKPEVMKSAVDRGIYENLPCYIDHCPDKTSGRRVKDLAGIWTNVHYDEATNRVRGDLKTLDQHRDIIFDIAQNGPTLAAPSHVVEGRTMKIKENGKVIEDVLHIEKGHSVDIVAGAATVSSLLEKAQEDNLMTDAETITLEELRTLRPELVEEITANKGNEQIMENLRKEVEDLKKERDTLKEDKANADKKSAHAESQRLMAEALKSSPLPEAAKEELKNLYKDETFTEDQIKTVVESQVTYLEKVMGKKLTKDPVKLPTDSDEPKDKKSPRNILKEGFLKKAGIEIKKDEDK